ncbi:MAG: hypothetical protein HDR88_05170 [Bacteroides sp.]|nr:hypothetical protein [Bacteroides sp.]
MKQFFTTALLGCTLFALPAHAQLEVPAKFKNLPTASTRSGVEDIVWEADGTPKNYTKTYSGCYAYMEIEWVDNLEVPSQIVWGENNEVYFQDIISMMPFGTYTKGTAEGNKITVSLPQTLFIDEEEYKGEIYQTLYNLNLMMPFEDGGFTTYFPVEEPSDITFSIADDGTVTLDSLEEGYTIGLTADEGDGPMWMGFAEYAMTFAPESTGGVNPADLDNTPYSYFTPGYNTPATDQPEFGYKVNVAFDGDDVYFTGLCLDDRSWWFKGHREGNKVVVDNNQSMGVLAGVYNVSLMFGKRDAEAYGGFSFLPSDTQFVFNYDEEARKFTTDTPEVIMFINALPDQIYYLSLIEDPTFIYQPTAAGTPRNPWNLIFNAKTYDKSGYGLFDVNLPIVATDGTLLDRENMYYNIYIDGEIFEFDAYEYGLPEDTENIPYNFMSNPIVCSKLSTYHEMLFHVQGFDKIGVKLVNVYDGVTYESDIVEIDVEENGITSGINETSSANVINETYYDLSGRKVSNPSNGIFIKHTLLDNGTVKVTKAIRR